MTVSLYQQKAKSLDGLQKGYDTRMAFKGSDSCTLLSPKRRIKKLDASTIGQNDHYTRMTQRYELTQEDLKFITSRDTHAFAIELMNQFPKNLLKFEKFEKIFDPKLVQLCRQMMAFNP